MRIIAQRISTAMAIVPILDNPNPDTTSLFPIGSSGIQNLFCDSTLLPNGYSTALCVSTHRRLNIARRLLTATARTFIHGCPLDPEKGQVAFSTDW